MPPSITFETKCWENDWRPLLKTKRIETMIKRNNYNFQRKVLLINNVKDYKLVSFFADRLIEKKVLTNYFIVKDYAQLALDFFGLSKESLGVGYVYSIAEFVGIYLCASDYLLHFSSDSILNKNVEWIEKAISKMEKYKNIKVANLVWNNHYDEARKESFLQDDDFFIGYGFSDQMYLVRCKDFKAKIYNETNSFSSRYPSYGGELFEKRIDAWMRNHGYMRATYKHGSYSHKNFEPSKIRFLKKKLGL